MTQVHITYVLTFSNKCKHTYLILLWVKIRKYYFDAYRKRHTISVLLYACQNNVEFVFTCL